MIVHPAAPSFKAQPKQTEKGAFREDFYYRIRVIVIPIKIPLLRERIEDIPKEL
jgi:transcriptional regulator with PAS, ATPase and Fis domain